MEDDMTSHEQAREDCLAALKNLSMMPCRTPETDPKPQPIENEDITVDELMKDIEGRRAGDLSAEQLEMLLSYRRDGELFNRYLVSLGDLGRKDIRHEPGDAGTTKSFEDARDFLDGFGLPYELVSGNHGKRRQNEAFYPV